MLIQILYLSFGGKGWKEMVYKRGMEEAPENSKELSHSAHANGMNVSGEVFISKCYFKYYTCYHEVSSSGM